MIKVWLVKLAGLTNSLSTSNFLERKKNVYVFLIKAVNSLMASHPVPPTKNIWWLGSNVSISLSPSLHILIMEYRIVDHMNV